MGEVEQRRLSQSDIVKVGKEVLDIFSLPGHVIFIHHDTKPAIIDDVSFKGNRLPNRKFQYLDQFNQKTIYRLHGQIFAPCKICIPHILVGYAGGRAPKVGALGDAGAVVEVKQCRPSMTLCDTCIHPIHMGYIVVGV